jgi:hypothetical protein
MGIYSKQVVLAGVIQEDIEEGDLKALWLGY